MNRLGMTKTDEEEVKGCGAVVAASITVIFIIAGACWCVANPEISGPWLDRLLVFCTWTPVWASALYGGNMLVALDRGPHLPALPKKD